jgi:hypothetical protein
MISTNSHNGYLVRFEAARRALEEARTVDEVKDVRDKAEALRLYTRQAGESLDMQNACAEIKLRAERKIGEMSGPPKHGGDRKSSGRMTLDCASEVEPSLKKRCRRVASVPEKVFEQHIATVKDEKGELTTAAGTPGAAGLRTTDRGETQC